MSTGLSSTEVAADSPGASVAADLATGEHGGPRQAAFAMAGKARTKLELCFTNVDYLPFGQKCAAVPQRGPYACTLWFLATERPRAGRRRPPRAVTAPVRTMQVVGLVGSESAL